MTGAGQQRQPFRLKAVLNTYISTFYHDKYADSARGGSQTN